jgi:hypothetical protein
MEAQKSINLQEAEKSAADLCGNIFALWGELSTLKNDQKQNADTPDYIFDGIWWSSLSLTMKNDKDIFINWTKSWSYSLALIQSWIAINQVEMYDFNTWYWYFIVCNKEWGKIQVIRTSKNAKKNEKNQTVFDWLETIKNAEETTNETACHTVYTILLPKIKKLLEQIHTKCKEEIDAKLHEQKKATANAVIHHLTNFNF